LKHHTRKMMPNTTPNKMPPPCDEAFHISSFFVYLIMVTAYAAAKIALFP